MRERVGRTLLVVALSVLTIGLGHQVGQAQETGSSFQFYDVAKAQQDQIQEEWSTITEWMTETHGLTDPNIQIHIGSTEESLADLIRNATGLGRCSWTAPGQEIVYLLLPCFRQDATLVGWYVAYHGLGTTADLVVEEGHVRRGPQWLSNHLFTYLGSRFAEHQGTSLAAERARRQLESATDWEILESIERRDVYFATEKANQELGWLAVDWLVRQAEETSYVEYMTQRGEYRTWEEALLAKFGLTPAQFYARFARARPEIERIVTGATEAEADATDREGIWLSTPLYPGNNLIGWIEAPTPIGDLFAAIPRVEIAYTWDAIAGKWFAAWTGGGDLGGLKTLRPGMGVWLRISEGVPMRWERRVAPGNRSNTTLLGYAQLGTGHNHVAWVGWPNSFDPLGRDLARVYEWDPAFQQWTEPLTLTDQGLSSRLQSAQGYGLSIQVGRPGLWRQALARWWPAEETGRDWIRDFEYWGEVSTSDRTRLVEQVRDIVAFFQEKYSVTAETDVFVAADDISGADMFAELQGPNAPVYCGYADTNELRLVIECQGANHIDRATFAHEYFHILQNSRYNPRHTTSSGFRDDAPFWFTEGGATYANALYDEHLGHRTYEEHRKGWERSAERISESLSEALVSGSNAPYLLGALASEWLAYQRGERALLEYFTIRNHHATVEETFEATFGLTLEEFYEEFAEWRAGGFQRIEDAN